MQRQQHSGDIEHCLVKSKAVTQSRDDPKKEKSQGSQNGGRWLNLYLLDSVFCLFSSFCHLLPPTGCSIQSALLVVSILKRAENEKIPGISSHCPIVNQKLFQRHPHSVLFLLPPLLPPDFFFSFLSHREVHPAGQFSTRHPPAHVLHIFIVDMAVVAPPEPRIGG